MNLITNSVEFNLCNIYMDSSSAMRLQKASFNVNVSSMTLNAIRTMGECFRYFSLNLSTAQE